MRLFNIRSIFILIIFVLSIALYFFTEARYATLLMVLLLVIILLALITAKLTGRNLSVSLKMPVQGRQGEPSHVSVRVKNNSALPVFLCSIKTVMTNLLTDEKDEAIYHLSIGRKKTDAVDFAVTEKRCGCVTIDVDAVRVSDPLGIINIKPKTLEIEDAKGHIYYMPKAAETLIPAESFASYDMESYKYSPLKSGNDPSEIFDIREYEQNDSMKAIHWKLTGKMDTPMVKEFGLPVENKLMVIVDKAKANATAEDIEADTEDDILRARVDVAAEICKLSHHGGNSSNTRAFLNAVNAVYYYYNYCEDSPSRYSPAGTWSYGPTQSAKQIGNVASVRYNGDITYGVYDDVITQELERNYTTNTIYLYDPDDPEKLRGILTQDFNRATTKYIDQRAYGDYDFSTTKRENSYVEDGWFIGNGDTQYYYRNNEPVTGWLVDGDAKYYMDPDTGKKETGWLTVGSDTYFFDEYGRMQTGFVKVGTAVHHFDDEGRQTKTGWALIDGNRYYFGAYNKMAQGVYTIDGKKYLFDRNTGIMQIGVVRQGSSLYFTDDSGVLYPAGWTDYNGSRYYLDSNGRASTGWNKVSGNWYLMGSDGVMLTGWQRAGGIWYYLDDGGVMQTGWQQFGGRMYYLSGSGAMQTGWQKIDGAWYYMNGSGVMQTGWQKIDGKWYYMNAGGAMQTGWQRIGSVWYYMNDSGVMQTGWQLIGGKWYYFKSSGAWVR